MKRIWILCQFAMMVFSKMEATYNFKKILKDKWEVFYKTKNKLSVTWN